MPKCVDQDFYCQNPDYSAFDNLASSELVNPPTVDEIINKSEFCTNVPLFKEFQLEDLTHNDYIRGLNNKCGIYHLWIDFEHCDDHETHTMRCIYVGKGVAEVRVNDHIRKKFRSSDNLYVGFYECSNRMSKYLEQLFLDIYDFDLNSYENPGTAALYAVWDHNRYTLGTELHRISDLSQVTDFEL